MRDNRQLPEKHKMRLYPVVLELFSQKDFHKVNIQTISRKSGVSLGTIYKYYSSKEDMLFSILEEYLKEAMEIFILHIKGLKSSKEIFRKILWSTMYFYDRNPGVGVTAFITLPMRTWMQQDAYKTEVEVWNIFAAEGHQRGDLDPAVDGRLVRELYLMICYRVIHMWYYHGMKWTLVDAVNRDFEFYWKMLAPPDSSG